MLSVQELKDRAVGCLLGGALGDALGATVEFMPRAQIVARYGENGIQELDEAYGRVGAITDDTQMTLFAADGLIRAWVRGRDKGITDVEGMAMHSFQRWLETQGRTAMPFAVEPARRGWLMEIPPLNSPRAPGVTCLNSLNLHSMEPAKNDSKGCGTVMRSAPYGFFPDGVRWAEACSRLTHGHPEATASAGAMAFIIGALLDDVPLSTAVSAAVDKYKNTRTSSLLQTASESVSDDPVVVIPTLGEGWVADEALAIGVYCALRAGDDLLAGLRWAVNHDGDSDSTGSICGNLIGAAYGARVLPADWLEKLELREDIQQVAEDMIEVVHGDADALIERYPPG